MTVTLVIGAAASGKSAYAESLCLGHDGPRVYLATMEPFGEEGARRIARHRALREGKGFSTLERTRDAVSYTHLGRVLGARGGLAHDGAQAESYERSKLYDPSFATGYRKASS